MKRAIAAGVGAAALLLATGWSFAADPGIDPAQVKGKITYYTHFTSFITDGLFDKWVGDFKKLYPNADVDVQGIATYEDTMGTRLATGDYGDVLDTPAPTVARYDVILVGDLFYERDTAARALAFLERNAAVGSRVLIGDPGRTYLPKERLTRLAEYSVPVTRELEDMEIKRTSVWELV